MFEDPNRFEASGNLDDWPPNVPGKPTQVAVFGVLPTGQLKKGKRYEITFTGQFPDLDKAMYWGAKKEIATLRTRGFMMASRVIWQHELTPAAAVEWAFAKLGAQADRAMAAAELGFDPESAMRDGPLKPVDPAKVHGYTVELEAPNGERLDLGFFRGRGIRMRGQNPNDE